MDDRAKSFLGDNKIPGLLVSFGEIRYYPVFPEKEVDAIKNNWPVITGVIKVDTVEINPSLRLVADLNNAGFNKFRIYDNSSRTGWRGYTPHIICSGLTVEAVKGFYDSSIDPEDKGEVVITFCLKGEEEKIVDPSKRAVTEPLNDYSKIVGDDYRQAASTKVKEADNFLLEHRVEEVISQYGRFIVYGSHSLGLMYRNDIDAALVVEDKDLSVPLGIIEQFRESGFNNFWLFDNRHGGSAEDPGHLLLDTYTNEWELSFSICKEAEVEQVLEMTEYLRGKLEKDPQLKDKILRLKFEVGKKHGVRTYPSKLIYDAVINKGITDVEDFEKLVNL